MLYVCAGGFNTHTFNRLWSLLRLWLSRLEDRENSSSHHTCHKTSRYHHPHHYHPSCCSLYHQHRTFASSSCEAMKLSWLTLTRSEAVTTVTMRFSSRPTRFPTSSSSRSLASYWLRGATSEWCRGRGERGVETALIYH